MFGDERDLSAPMPPESGLPALIDMENETIANADFRRVIWTGLHTQVVLMSLEPGEVIDREVHPEIDQFFRVERGMIVIDAETDAGLKKILVKTGQAGVVPAGTYHTVYASDVLGAKLYTNYSPPNHPPNRVQPQKPKGGD